MVWESSRERWRDGAGVYRTLRFRPRRSLHACWRGRARDATDFRPSRNGVGGACASRRTVWESSRERWRDGAGWLPDLKISAPSVVARILAWVRDATDFRPSRNGVGGACASRRTVWKSGRERSCDAAGRLADLRISAPSVVACILARACDATDFRTGVGSACASRRTA